MDQGNLLTFEMNAITIILEMITPFLLVSLILGSVISLFQAATQINEATLTIVPKIIATIAILAILGGWIGGQMLAYTSSVFQSLPALAP